MLPYTYPVSSESLGLRGRCEDGGDGNVVGGRTNVDEEFPSVRSDVVLELHSWVIQTYVKQTGSEERKTWIGGKTNGRGQRKINVRLDSRRNPGLRMN